MKRTLSPLLSRTAAHGAALVEYGALVGLVAVVSIGSVAVLGQRANFDYLVAALEVHETTNPLENFLTNGDFDDVTGMTPSGWGYYSPTTEGWTSNNGLNFEFHNDGWQGMDSVNGNYWLDTQESPGGMDIEQTVDGLETGAVYKITLWAGDRDSDLDGEAMVFWNGSLVGTLDPTVEDTMQDFTFFIQSGAGTGEDRVRIVDIGPDDANGISLDEVRIYGRGSPDDLD